MISGSGAYGFGNQWHEHFRFPDSTIFPKKYIFDITEIKPLLQSGSYISLRVDNATGEFRPKVHAFAIKNSVEKIEIPQSDENIDPRHEKIGLFANISMQTIDEDHSSLPPEKQPLGGIGIYGNSLELLSDITRFEIIYE